MNVYSIVKEQLDLIPLAWISSPLGRHREGQKLNQFSKFLKNFFLLVRKIKKAGHPNRITDHICAWFQAKK